MCNFKIGQRVVCIKRDQWVYADDLSPTEGPKYGEELIVVGIDICSDGAYLYFTEYIEEGKFRSYNFRPLITDYTEEELASVDISPLIEELELETV